MAQGLITNTYLENIANAIRYKSGSVALYTPANMADAINNIPTGGGANLGPKTITANGIYNASDDSLDGYNAVTVAVPIPVYNTGVLDVTTNGDYNAASAGYDGFNDVHVAVPIPTYNSTTLEVTSNGVYNAVTAGYDGYSEVNVQVPTGGASEVVVFLDGMSLFQNDVTGLLGDKDPSTLAKVYCNNISSINGTSYDNSVLEKDVAWTAVTNGYYNAQYNTYIYNNYLPVQRDSSLYAKFQGNSSFNLAVRTSRAVTNMAYMMNGCSTFDNSVQIGNSVTNCRSIVMDCTNFNQPLHFPNSVVNARSALWGCTNFNSPVIFDEGMHDLDLRGLFADTSFNLPFTIPNGTINVGVMFQNALFNQPIVIPNSVNAPEGLAYFLFNATSFNQPITIGSNITNCVMAFDCPHGDGSFNQDIYFPYNVNQYNYALYGQSNFESNLYINNRFAMDSNFYYFLGGTNNSKRKNIFCYNLSALNRTSSSTLIGDSDIAWTPMDNGYYNSAYNIYLYNNYLGKQGGTSLTSMISLVDKSNFNLPVSMEDTVTNCYNMLANCFNFNSPVEFSNNLQNGQRAMRFCNNFNLPITVPASLTDTYQMFGYCTRLNSPITLTHGLTTMYGMFRHCDSLNQPINIPNTVTNCYDAISYTAMNCDVYIPASVTDCVYMMSGTNVFEGNIYINGTPNCKGLLEDRNYTTRVNIFCNDLSILTGTTPSDSITDLAMTWTPMDNGYYNSQYNIYLYNNYEGEPVPTHLTYTWSAQDSSPVTREYNFVTNVGTPITPVDFKVSGNQCWNMGEINMFVTENGSSERQLTNGTDYSVVWSGSNQGNANYILTADLDELSLDSVRMVFKSVYRVNTTLDVNYWA